MTFPWNLTHFRSNETESNSHRLEYVCFISVCNAFICPKIEFKSNSNAQMYLHVSKKKLAGWANYCTNGFKFTQLNRIGHRMSNLCWFIKWNSVWEKHKTQSTRNFTYQAHLIWKYIGYSNECVWQIPDIMRIFADVKTNARNKQTNCRWKCCKQFYSLWKYVHLTFNICVNILWFINPWTKKKQPQNPLNIMIL